MESDIEVIGYIKEIREEIERMKSFVDTIEEYRNKSDFIKNIEMCISNINIYLRNIKENKIKTLEKK